MLDIKSTVEYFHITFALPDDGDIDENQARNQADAWMQKKFGDLFMGGYAFEDAWQKRRTYIVQYSR